MARHTYCICITFETGFMSWPEFDSPFPLSPEKVYVKYASFEPAWANVQGVKIFSILVQISPSYSNFSESPRGMYDTAQSQSPRGIIYCAESYKFSRSYLKEQSNKIFDLFFS